MEKRIKDDVLRIYEKLDTQIEKFKAQSLLRCAQGCGRCCENPQIFVTVLEVLPLAYELWQSSKALQIIAQIKDNPLKQVCVFYEADRLISGQGRCGIYPLRPLICRLFGFSAKNDKYGQPHLVTCPTIKNSFAQEYQQAQMDMRQEKLKAPLMQDYAMQLLNVEPNLGTQQFPINQAVLIALEKVGLLNAQEKI